MLPNESAKLKTSGGSDKSALGSGSNSDNEFEEKIKKRIARNYGEPFEYDTSFQGPRERRPCTDIFFLVLFVLFLLCWSVLGYYAFRHGDVTRLLHPTDSDHLKCGLDQSVKDKPYLFVFEPDRCADATTFLLGCTSKKVCVSKCPDFDFLAKKHFADAHISRQITPYCVRHEAPVTGEELSTAVRRRKCPPWIKSSIAVGPLCVPNVHSNSSSLLEMEGEVVMSSDNFNKILNGVLQKPHGIQHKDVLTGTIRVGTPFYDDGYVSRILSDITASYKEIVVTLFVAMAASFVYILLMRLFSGLLVWSSILLLIALLGVGAYLCYDRYAYLRGANINEIHSSGVVFTEDDEGLQKIWFALMVICLIVAAILLLVVIFLRTRIQLSVALIKESGKAVTNTISTLVFPLIPWSLYIGLTGYFVLVVLNLHTSGKPMFKVVQSAESCRCKSGQDVSNMTACLPDIFERDCSNCIDQGSACVFHSYKNENSIIYLQLANLFGFFWVFNFIKGMAEMILAGTFATWYWTMKKSNVPFFVVTRSFFRSISYNSGTVAFGALLIAIVQTIRAMLEYIQHKLKAYDNGLARCILCCCQCFWMCVESFLKFISHNAYIMCALHGTNFCSSARDAFNLLMRNVIRVVVLEKVTSFVLWVGKAMIAAGAGTGLYFYLDRHPIPNLAYIGTPLLFSIIGSYVIASIFFGVYSVAVDTLFLCFLEDQERNDGTPEKPYYMSKNLMKILGKKGH